jgi:glycerol-1-phosphate dehydrogenase [NAD(P)+]
MNQHIIQTKEDFLSRTSTALANSVFHCPDCGRDHKIPYQKIMIGAGIRRQVPEIIREALGKAPALVGLVFDRAIEDMIQTEFIRPFKSAGLNILPIPLGEAETWLDSTREIGDEAARQVPAEVDILVAAGSGVICDLTKWIATQTQKPYILCGTAPSMNGYTSITAVIAEHDIKLTKYVNIPYAVILDTELIAKAPTQMIHAGYGDLTARAICNADWKLSEFLHGSYFCPLPFEMTRASEASYLAASEGIARAEPQSIIELTEAIAISGLSMSILDGETSPSSGGEHVISHYWDLISHLEGAPRNFHGAQVGIGTLMMLAAYQYFASLTPAALDPERIICNRPSLEQVLAWNDARFGSAAGPLNETSRKKYLPDEKFSQLVYHVVRDWDQLWSAIRPYTASLETIRSRMQAAGLPLTLDSVQRTRTQAVDALLFGGRYRPRYTFLDLAWDLGLFPSAAEAIIDLSGVAKGL